MQPLRFRALGFDVVVHPWFGLTVLIAVLYRLPSGNLLLAFTWGLVVFVSILVHELGHALVARALKVRVGAIQIHGLGGQVEHARTSPGRQLAISLAGPGAGLSLGLLTLTVAAAIPSLTLSSVGSAVVADLLFVNVVWSVFNLLPLFPLDGGNALRSGLALFIREVEAWRITAGLGLLIGAGLVFLGYTSGEIFVLYIAGSATVTNWQILQQLPAR
ncbi:MAG: hypothetical protein H6735_12775 [Alphaproteobacteria bacterium]|nr:hypothetical protein [Alphaproteobacteria bacterium]